MEKDKGLLAQANKDVVTLRVGRVAKPFTLNDYFMRLKTTSVSSDKYAEVLEILFDMFMKEREKAEKSVSKLD